MAGGRGPGLPALVFTAAVAGIGFIIATRVPGSVSAVGVFIMALGIVLFFLGVLLSAATN